MQLKLITVFLLAATLHGMAATSQQVSISGKQLKLEKIFRLIEQQTGYSFIYNKALLSKAALVNMDVKEGSLQQVLNTCLEPNGLSYEIESKIIVIKKKLLAAAMLQAAAPPDEFHGKIVDSTGAPLAGASVLVKGTKNGVQTDADGAFALKGIPTDAVLIISFAGFTTREVALTAESTGFTKGEITSLLLRYSENQLGEIVIVNKGYYSTRKILNTGDVSTVSSKTIGQQPVSNPLAALAGQVPGLFITQSSGNPGGAFKVQIRGQNSIASGNDPLYVIDGVPFSIAAQLQTNTLNPAGGNPLNFINTQDIESIEVLKDADATAIYGSRGANGVVLITTKSGKAGETKVDVNVYQGAGKVTHTPKLLNSEQFLEMRKEAFKNDGAEPDPGYDFDVLGGSTWNPHQYTDWQKLLIGGTAKYTDAQASVSGGSEQMQYLVGGGYHRETTVFPGEASDQKGSVHFNISSTSKNHRFRMSLSGNYILDQTTLPVVEATYSLPFLVPNSPSIYNADGSLNWADGTWLNGNPLSYIQQPYHGRTSNLVSNLVLSYTLARGLELKSSMGYTTLQSDQSQLYPLSSIDPAAGLTSGSSLFNKANTRSWIIEPQLNYKTRIGKSELSALVGTTFQQSHNEGIQLAADQFSSDLLLNNIQAAAVVTTRNATDIQYKYNALYGRLGYSWDDKYILNVTARRDGSSRFGPGRQFANFGAVGAAWVFTKEKRISEALPFLSFGKFRASYGTSGNDQVADYTFLDRYGSTTYPYSGTQGLYPLSIYNKFLGWEQNRKIEAGLELGFFNGHLSFTGSYYHNRSSNQLIATSLSTVTGFASISENLPATVQNTGWEFMVNTVNVQSGRFKWTSALNLTLSRNKLIAFPNLAASSYNAKLLIGQPITIQRMYQFAGVDPQTGLYQVMGADGKLTSDPIPVTDAISVVNTAPKYYGGLQNTFTYGQFSLDFLLQFVKQRGLNYLYNGVPGEFGSSQPVTVLDRWQKPGDIATIQRFNQDYSIINATNAAALSDQQYKDASYIRVKNVAFAYSLPGSWLHRVHLKNARLYFQGQNLFTITHYIGFDPENQSQITLPPLKVWTFGFQLTL